MKQILSTFALLSIATTPLFAEESAISAIQELPVTIVTGELWESELQKTTASVTVLDRATLENNGIQHFEDVIKAIPNLTWTGGTSRPRYIQIRGIGENSQFEGETPDSSVRFLIDDLDFTGVGTIGNLFDVQQVEVLRGPQAGAFGANAAGGMIRIVTNDPTPYWTGQAESTIGNDSLFAGGFAVGGPLLKNNPEKLTFRIALHQLTQDGFSENVFLNKHDTNERDEFSSRLKVRWLANEDWEVNGTVLYADFDNGYDEFSLGNTDFKTFSDSPGRDVQETKAGSLRATWFGQDDFTLTSVTSAVETDSVYSYDADWGAGYIAALGTPAESGYFGFLSVDRRRNVYSEELRIDSKDKKNALGFIDRWTLGLYYNEIDEFSDVDYSDEFSLGTATSDYKAENYAIFTQFAHDFSDSTRMIIGLRYEHHEVDFSSNVAEDYFGSLVAGETSASQDDGVWGGKLTLEHDVQEEHMLFASITRGYKVGGANTGAFSLPTDPTTYEDETLWNYEIGLHSDWFNGHVTSQITLFYLDRRDAQLRDSAGAGGFFRYFTTNQGDAEHYGLEAESTWFFAENMTLRANLGIMETELDATSRDVSNAPALTYSARIDYRPINGLFAGVELVGSDEYYESNSHNEKRSSYAVVNGSIGYQIERWTITLWAKNLLDETYEERVFLFDNYDPDGLGEQRYQAPSAPRSFGVTANYRW
ncbi:MAG: TonB-dependent receptor [Verrucomicrobiota bacterium]|nr:TonB-dependent receptor [Verrucomicrobiota bacterium]